MAILPSGYKNTKILEISCDDFILTITGNPKDKKSENLNINRNVIAQLLVSGEYEDIVSVRSISSEGELIESREGVMLPSFYENGEYQVVLISNDGSEYNLIHMESNLYNNMQQFNNFKVGLIKFESDIGYSTLKIIKNGVEILNIIIEVFPSKLNYKEDYKEIIQDINGEISALAFEMLGKTYLNTVLKDTNNQSNSEYINILKLIFDDLEKDIKRVCKHFKHNIQTIESIKSIEKSRVTSRRTVDYIRKHPHTLLEDKRGFIEVKEKSYIPTKVVDKRKITTIDIFENRYVKYMINTIIRRLTNIENNIAKVYKKESPYSEFIRNKRVTLERYLKNYFTEISDLKDKKSM